MEYGTMVGISCIYLLNEKKELLSQLNNINHQLEDIHKYNSFDMPSETSITLYNKETMLKSQAQQIQEQIKKIDKDFDTITRGLLLAFSKTNILDKDLTEQIIYGRI